MGLGSLSSNTAGSNNIAIGVNALCANLTSGNNVGIGRNSLRANTGRCNVAVGYSALCANTSGWNNTALGHLAQRFSTGADDTIAIGCGATTSSTTGHTVWGNAANNVCNCVYAAWSNVSDCRDKTEVETLPDNLGLNLIKKLRPVKFKWDHRDTYVRKCGYEYGEKDGTLVGTKEHYGLIAQELKQTLDELNARFDGLGHDEEKDAYRLTYEELIAPLIKSVQELDTRITALENK
jgi:hypothetical protein